MNLDKFSSNYLIFFQRVESSDGSQELDDSDLLYEKVRPGKVERNRARKRV